MVSDDHLRKLLGNIINDYKNSNCRLCLQEIEEDYVCFEDNVLDSTGHRPLSQLVSNLLGAEFCDPIQGAECICVECVDKLIELSSFVAKCSTSSNILSRAIDSVNAALQQDFSAVTKKLYIKIASQGVELVQIYKKKSNKISKEDLKYECLDCNKKNYSLEDLKEHNLQIHASYTCNQCMETFLNQEQVDNHVCLKEFQCQKCKYLFKSEKALENHTSNVHKKYICTECGKSYTGRDSLANHERIHTNRKNECPNCGKVYLTTASFEKHRDLCSQGLIDPHPRRSESVRDFACDKCEKRYSTEGGLRVHKRFVHGNAKPHICEHCGKKFTAPSCLKTHMVKHTRERNFECTICKHKFVSKEALLYHTRRHTGDKPYSCKLCPEKFVNASARAEHIKYKHEEPKHECNVCGRKFADAVYLRKHEARHEDRTSKLYAARHVLPPNVPGLENMRVNL